MTCTNRIISLATASLIVLCVGPIAGSLAATPGWIQGQDLSRFRSLKTNDAGLRKLAVAAPTPIYPRRSLNRRVSGVAVIEVEVNSEGQVHGLKVVEAPDTEIAEAVQEAVRKWTFRSTGTPVRGTLIFYFRLHGVKGDVSSPAEMTALRDADTHPAADTRPSVRYINEEDLSKLLESSKPTILDIRHRSLFDQHHRQGALNIPLGELLTRAPNELSPSVLLVIDCFPIDYEAKACAVAAHQVESSGVRQILILRR